MPFATPFAQVLSRAVLALSTVVIAFIVALALLQSPASADADNLPQAEAQEAEVQAGAVIDGSYIVVLKELPGASIAAERRSSVATLRLATQRAGGKIKHSYEHALKGFAAEMTPEQAAALRANPAVAYVEPDYVVTKQAEQTDAPWGLDRIDQRGLNLDGSYFHDRDGTGVDVYIADTGIRSTHNEFGGRVLSGFVAQPVALDGNGTGDCDGHGTHVAGTAGGATYGVAKNVNLIPVRVLDCDGNGSTADIVAGLDWIIANADGPSVVNVSIGGPASNSFDAAVARVWDAGITIVVAAANDNRDACSVSPSREEKSITVGSVTPDDTRSEFSNYGECLTLFAPGHQVRSAWWFGDDEVNVISGTSMAAPHVTGVVAQYLSEFPDAAPVDIAAAITAGATPGTITDARVGSPNLMLYSYITSDPAPPTDPPVNNVTVTVDVAEHMAEGAGQAAALEVEFSDYPLTPVTIDWSVTGGSADIAADLSESSGTATFSAVDLRVDLTELLVTDWVIDDAEAEGDETLQLTYTVTGGAVAAAATVDLVIVDNDDAPTSTSEIIDDFETDLGWAIDPGGSPYNAETGNFEVAAMEASPVLEGFVYQLGNAVSGTKALVTAGLGGDQPGTYDVDTGSTGAERSITLPTDAAYIEVSSYFAHYSNATPKDIFELKVNDKVIVRHEGADDTLQAAEWSKVRADISEFAGQTVLVSASVGDLGAGSLIEAAVDDIVVWTNSFSCASDGGNLTWTDVDQSKYWVYKSTDGGLTYSWIGRTLGATTFTDTSPAVGTKYQVHYAGIPRTECDITAEPDPSQLFTCASDGGNLTWTDAGQDKYWVYRSTDGGLTYSWIGRTLGATTFAAPNPTIGALYQVHYAGIPRVDCSITAEPAAGQSFTCSESSGIVSWTDAGQDKYWVYRSTDGVTYSWIGRTLGATSFTDPSPVAGATYQVHYAGIPRVNCT